MYAITTALVVRLATGADDVQQADQRGAIATLARQTFAGWMLALLAVGLLAFALWRFYDALTAEEAVPKRAMYAASGMAYLALGVLTINVLLPGRDDGGGDGAASLTARAMNLPGGRLVVAIVGAGVVGVGGYYIVKGVQRRFMKSLELDERSAPWAAAVGVLGWVGRGTVFVAIGVFVFRAAITHNPGEAKGLDGALKTLIGESYGRPVLVAVAAGFAAYAALCLVEAKYRRYDD